MQKALAVFVWFALALSIRSVACAQSVVPMTLVDNRPIVTVTANGVPLSVILDTGGSTILDPAAARRLGISFKWSGSTNAAGEGTSRTASVTLQSLCVAALCDRNVSATILDLSTIAHKTGLGSVDGVIGSEFLNEHVVTLRYGKRELVVDAPEPQTGTPFEFYGGTIPKVHASVDGVDGTFFIDTGDRSAMTLFPAFAHSKGFDGSKVARRNAVTGWGVGGPVMADLFVAQSIAIGSAVRKSLVVRISIAKSGGFSASDVDGSISTGFLRYFDVTLSYKNRLMVLTPNGAQYQDACAVASDVIAPQPCMLAP